MGKIFIYLFDSLKALSLLGFLVSPTLVSAQFSSLSAPVKKWALLHPFAAIKVKKIQDQCSILYDQKQIRQELDSFSSGGKLDAYRHVFNMAAFSQKLKTGKIRKLGIAHEKGNYRQFKKSELEEGEKPDSLASVMDLRNNELGLSIGCNFPYLSLDSLSRLVISEINNGKAWVFLRNNKGHYLDCNRQKIDPARYRHQWYVPKCLVRSDTDYKP